MRGSGEGGGSLESVIARIDAIEPGSVAADTVPSGFPSLDRMLGGGLRRQDLAILAGDVSSGTSRSRWAAAPTEARAVGSSRPCRRSSTGALPSSARARSITRSGPISPLR